MCNSKNMMLRLLLIATVVSTLGYGAIAQKEKPVTVKYLPGEIISITDEGVLVKSGVEITAPAHRWFGVYFSLMTGEDKFLKYQAKTSSGDLLWSNLFTPDPQIPLPARWTDLRMMIPKTLLSQGVLPAKSETTIFVVCRIWNDKNRDYVGTGFAGRIPIVVTTDVSGAVVSIVGFNTKPFSPGKNHPTLKIPAQKAQMKLEHLKLKDGAELYQAYKHDKTMRYLLKDDKVNALLTGSSRGMFFDEITSADHARELAQLSWVGGVVIKTKSQYQSFLAATKSLGMTIGEGTVAEDLEFADPQVKVIGKLGWAVTFFVVRRRAKTNLLGDVIAVEVTVGRDGRISSKQTNVIQSPTSLADAKKYSKVISKILTTEGSMPIPAPCVTGKKLTIPCPTHSSDGDWLDPDLWSGK